MNRYKIALMSPDDRSQHYLILAETARKLAEKRRVHSYPSQRDNLTGQIYEAPILSSGAGRPRSWSTAEESLLLTPEERQAEDERQQYQRVLERQQYNQAIRPDIFSGRNNPYARGD